MIKFYCDRCGRETNDIVRIGYSVRKGAILLDSRLHIFTGDLEYCKDCALEFIGPDLKVRIKELDDQEERERNRYTYNDAVSLESDLSMLDMTVRTYTCLTRHGVHSVRELLLLTDEDLKTVRNLGRRSYEEAQRVREIYMDLLKGENNG